MSTLYRQRMARDGFKAIASAWTLSVGEEGFPLIPDACVDLVWVVGGHIWVCGPETQAWERSIPAGTLAMGVRLRPGVAHDLFRLPMSELRDKRVPLDALWGTSGERVLRRLEALHEHGSALDGLEHIVRKRLSDHDPLDHVARGVLSELSISPNLSMSSVAERVGLSQRQLQRRCQNTFGYGPSVLKRVIRLQRFARLVSQTDPPLGLAALATEAGYADQAHLSRECRTLVGSAPSSLIRPLRRGWVSDPFKTS